MEYVIGLCVWLQLSNNHSSFSSWSHDVNKMVSSATDCQGSKVVWIVFFLAPHKTTCHRHHLLRSFIAIYQYWSLFPGHEESPWSVRSRFWRRSISVAWTAVWCTRRLPHAAGRREGRVWCGTQEEGRGGETHEAWAGGQLWEEHMEKLINHP